MASIPRLYHATSFQSPSGRWCVGDFSAVGKMSNAWWLPARMMNMELTDYVLFLIKHKASHIIFDDKTLLFSFDNYADAHAWELLLNREAKKHNFRVTD